MPIIVSAWRSEAIGRSGDTWAELAYRSSLWLRPASRRTMLSSVSSDVSMSVAASAASVPSSRVGVAAERLSSGSAKK